MSTTTTGKAAKATPTKGRPYQPAPEIGSLGNRAVTESYDIGREHLRVGAILMFHSFLERVPEARLVTAIRHRKYKKGSLVTTGESNTGSVQQWADELVTVDNTGREKSLSAQYVRISKQYRLLVSR